MKVYFKWILVGIFLIFITGFTTYFFISSQQKITTVDKFKSKRYIVKGAFDQPGIHISDKKLTYRELFFLTQLKSDADIRDFNLDDIAIENQEIYVPYKNLILYWNSLRSANELISFGLSNKYAKLIMDYKEKNEGVPSWNDILKISGIGVKTIEKLQSFLILE
ncbi:MAG0490 family ComEA-like DNA-binding protein [Mycoplasmopsis felis]|uniref:MAG0490 family ComEA-like DNA-binding protein n=1 Tax=Mycoplasmopsis felis TaxID=33923 RepID=UPI0021AFBF0F|nr:helix-hairpin-helix domain-containing protein [Mycoplasmopsis felis]UWW00502.1 helix-hairpin-helix domain-containing protein [Mycoplasmopsis felis]WQQ02577.1 helix-hairpin-helix domain-containing protein [Mycoplasmopsis felis]WQQ04102.1 helix-hairpin-helix domain-containing protein [Mycoplasmopsis felis]WQQ04530.1 helix-hairpin-helix domain-containing protein [Mycoplasmopsis felis]WQQ06258.1 helix-hairpin-helix domain-containing protein [Mycoplasmopsis felis]